MSRITCSQFHWRLSFLSRLTFCLAPSRSFHSPSGVISVSLSVVLGVEEDQSESAPPHAWHERGAHHSALRADQVDQENDWWDHRMSARQWQKEYLRWRPLKHYLKTRLIVIIFFALHKDHFGRKDVPRPPVLLYWSTWCKLLRYWPTTQMFFLGGGRTRSGVIVDVETQRFDPGHPALGCEELKTRIMD